jgi:hypothetical protein
MPIKQHDTLASQRSSWPRDVQLRNDRAALIEVDEMEGILADVDTVATVDGMELRDAGRALWHCWLDPQCLRYCLGRSTAGPSHELAIPLRPVEFGRGRRKASVPSQSVIKIGDFGVRAALLARAQQICRGSEG